MAEREWFEKDYYKVLGLSTGATEKEITRAYRKFAKALHPDTNPGSEEKFKEISGAYDVLGDAVKRKEYDEVRRLGPAAAGFGTPAGQSGGFNFSGGDMGDLGELFGGLFGGGRRHPRGRPAEQRRLPHLPRLRRGAGHGVRHLRTLPGQGHHQRRPGAVRDV